MNPPPGRSTRSIEGAVNRIIARSVSCRGDVHRSVRAAREVLLRNRDDAEAARAAFRWPELEAFNWARDWFDVLAAGNRVPR